MPPDGAVQPPDSSRGHSRYAQTRWVGCIRRGRPQQRTEASSDPAVEDREHVFPRCCWKGNPLTQRQLMQPVMTQSRRVHSIQKAAWTLRGQVSRVQA